MAHYSDWLLATRDGDLVMAKARLIALAASGVSTARAMVETYLIGMSLAKRECTLPAPRRIRPTKATGYAIR
jgi:hypothetical protein